MLKRPFIVAANLFSWASEQGFVGVAVYFACWIFMFPLMLAICIVGGLIGWMVDKEDEEMLASYMSVIEHHHARQSDPGKTKWDERDRQYEAAKKELIEAQRLRGNGAK